MSDTVMIFVGIFMAFLMIPHIMRMVTEKSSAGQSLLALSGYMICYVLWIIYAVDKHDVPIIVCNALSVALGTVYWITIIYYRCCYGKSRCVPTALECWYEYCLEVARNNKLRSWLDRN
jgi:uncharacterized protein with PQ loop repeat